MNQKSWKEAFPKESRPEITDLETFMNPETYCLFKDFAEYILKEFDLRFGIPVWTVKQEWTYRIGKSWIYLITGIQIERNRFVVEHTEVANVEHLRLMIEYVDKLYQSNKEVFYAKIAEKNKRQSERKAKRIESERKELEALQFKIVPEKYMICCHGCGTELAGVDDFTRCNCERQYSSYKEYRRSYRKNNMPTGAAEKTFNLFIQNWERAKSYQDKIVLIDTLLHEFHLSLVSGATHRPVAMNFIDGFRSRVEQIISSLARNI